MEASFLKLKSKKLKAYLAIKYGFTKSNDYLNSDGDVIWDYSAMQVLLK
jgi:hypothetical protein